MTVAKRMIGISALAAILLTTTGATSATTSWPPEGTRILDRIVAVVDNEPVTLFELLLKAAPFEARLRAQGAEDLDKALRAVRAQVLDSLVNDILIRTEARKMRLEVTQDQVEAHLVQIKNANGWDDDDLLDGVKRIGFDSLADYRRNVKRELLKQQAIGYRVRGRIKISPDEIKKRLDAQLGTGGSGVQERRAAHIMLKAPELATEQQVEAVLVKLRELKALAESGQTTFEELARKHSVDTNAASGGDLGWLVQGDTDPDFEKAVWATPKEGVSDPFKTDFGFHIVKVTDVRVRNQLTPKKLASMKRQIRYRLHQEQEIRLLEVWMTELRRNVFIEVKDPELRPLVKSLAGQKRSGTSARR